MMNIVIQVVGSRGDIQPFVALGIALKEAGHRVRVATHETFRSFILEVGLEFFNIGGDPRKLMAYMVKNPGLLPSMETIRKGSISEKREDMREILQGCWRSCFLPDENDDPAATPFLANAIIANPPSFAHVHCAEKLGIPLHLMFTMPWSPTQAFPHPLANIQSSSLGEKITNYLSYMLLEELIWEGLGYTINSFRRKTLGLPQIDRSSGPNLVARLGIPSPALIPKPDDWGARISVSGFYFLPPAVDYIPPTTLQAFLDAGRPPIYIGFGSIVVDDPKYLTELLLEAVRLAGVRAVLSTGWSGLGDIKMPPEVLTVADCPHNWIFERVSCVVHHGGAGTTAAAIAAGKPSVVVPFFGDQPFWGNMIARVGAGSEPIPFKKLTAEKLADAIGFALRCNVRKMSRSIGDVINDEDGVQAGVRSFHQQLDLSMLQCSLTPMSAATWRVRKTDIKLGSTSSALLMDMGLLDLDKLELYKIHVGPRNPVTGIALAIFDSTGSAIKGCGEIGSSMSWNFEKATREEDVHFRDSRAGTFVKGFCRASSSLVRAPVHMGMAFTQGLHNSPRIWGDNAIRPLETVQDFPSGLKTGGKLMCLDVYEGMTSFITYPASSARRHSVLKVLSGVGIGILSGLCKTVSGNSAFASLKISHLHSSGLSAIITYPLGGLEVEATHYFSRKHISSLDIQLVKQGRSEYEKLSDEQRAAIVQKFKEATSGLKKKRFKNKIGRGKKVNMAKPRVKE
ncbi:uncharacterized protein N7443_006392 [Penicillium atrosanguineum]|uniref:uncharacterized protein n=1 Tax=Penicillium atrosanguineum TaxID=1132637 RepID=UPI00238E5C38|nr:uncharacterized protein N7443_006392 [Penicillium atrosanguineum]KAJ5298272.1 hypothetical protein N7443_006392 [Penicillium atrosanguineum]